MLMAAISVNVMVQTKNEFGEFDLKILNLQAMAQGELEPMDEWTAHEFECPEGSIRTMGRSCLKVVEGSPSCFDILC